MFKKKALLRAVIATGLASGLAACGGGSSSGSTPPSDPPAPEANTGQFVDSPVGGLEYEAKPSGITGVTGDDGSFRYMDGDAVYFTVGQYFVGSADGTELISPRNIGLNTEDAVANIARFLQTLDDDGIPENGITINNAARQKAKNSAGGEVSALDLSADTVKTGILDLTANNSVQREDLVDRKTALAHLGDTLDSFEARSKAQCESDAPAVEAEALAGNSFGRIGNGEITFFSFSARNEFQEIANDEGSLKDRDGTWSLDGQAKTLTLEFGEESDTVGICSNGQGIILDDGEKPMIFWEVAPFDDSQATAFHIKTGTDTGALLQLDTPGNSFTVYEGNDEKTGTYAIESDANPFLFLDRDDDSGFGEAFFLRGQDSRIAIYLDYTADGEFDELTAVGTATAIPTLSDIDSNTFAGNSFLLRNEDENSVYMLDFTSGSAFVRYTNESDTGQQEAVYSEGTWALTQNELTLTAGGISETFVTLDAGNLLFVADRDTDILTSLYKTQPVVTESFAGEYNVNIPTENVVNNSLVINENQTCSYDGTDCEWRINSKGHAVISFPGEPEQGHIWQVAGRTSAFGFVMKHEDKNDIEPGFMTRQ